MNAFSLGKTLLALLLLDSIHDGFPDAIYQEEKAKLQRVFQSTGFTVDLTHDGKHCLVPEVSIEEVFGVRRSN